MQHSFNCLQLRVTYDKYVKEELTSVKNTVVYKIKIKLTDYTSATFVGNIDQKWPSMICHIMSANNFEVFLFIAFSLVLVTLIDCFFQQFLIKFITIFFFPSPINFDCIQDLQN